jgi:hypothetical protein
MSLFYYLHRDTPSLLIVTAHIAYRLSACILVSRLSFLSLYYALEEA